MNFYKNYPNNSTETIHVFEKNRHLRDEAFFSEARDAATIDWDNLERITPSTTDEAEAISYDRALDYFKRADLSEYNEKVVRTVKDSGHLFACFSNVGKCKLKREHVDDYNLLFLIAKCPYQKFDKVHTAMLRTVYDSLVSNKDLDFSWENIGFQSNLPWTDLRGVGMLGVLQLLYISTLYPFLSNALYELSANKFNTFPLAVVSLNITSILLNALRHEKLNRDVNKEGVFVCVNKLYAAIFHHFGQTWSDEKKTILDIGKALKDIERSCFSKRARIKMVKNFERKLSAIEKISNDDR